MSEILRPNPESPSELLRSRRLCRADVEALSRITGRSFPEATQALLDMNLDGGEIAETRGSGRYAEKGVMVVKIPRILAAERVLAGRLSS